MAALLLVLGDFLNRLSCIFEMILPSKYWREHHRKYMSYLLTIFFFIWFLNILGLSPLGINVTGNIAVTFGLALLTFLITNLTANKNYWAHIFWMPGVPVLMKIVLAPIELLGLLSNRFHCLSVCMQTSKRVISY